MPGWIDLKFWMAVCWKMSWKLDPLPLSVPVRPLPEPPPVVLDELQAVSDKAIAARAAPAITTPWLRTRCMLNIPSQLPARVLRGGWPRWRTSGSGLAADDASGRPKDPAGRFGAGYQARLLHHFPVGHGIGIMEPGQAVRELDVGLSPRCRDRASPAVLASRGIPLHTSFSPMPATH